MVVVRKPAAECRVQLLIAAGSRSRSSVHCSDLMSTVAICGMWSGDPALCSSGSTSKYYNSGLYTFKFKYDQWRPATLRYVRQVTGRTFYFRSIVQQLATKLQSCTPTSVVRRTFHNGQATLLNMTGELALFNRVGHINDEELRNNKVDEGWRKVKSQKSKLEETILRWAITGVP